MKKFLMIAAVAFIATACNNTTEQKETVVKEEGKKEMAMPENETKYTADMVANKKDPTCGMPVTAGIHDTAHYDGKVYGFCATECKQEFLKDPKTGLTKME